MSVPQILIATVLLAAVTALIAAAQLAAFLVGADNIRRGCRSAAAWLFRCRGLRCEMPSFVPIMGAARAAAYVEVHSRCVFGGVHQCFGLIRGSESAVVRFFRKWRRSTSGRWRADPRLAIRRAHTRRRCQFPAEPGSAFWAAYEVERDAAVEEWRAMEAAKQAAEERRDRGFAHDYGFLSRDLWVRPN